VPNRRTWRLKMLQFSEIKDSGHFSWLSRFQDIKRYSKRRRRVPRSASRVGEPQRASRRLACVRLLVAVAVARLLPKKNSNTLKEGQNVRSQSTSLPENARHRCKTLPSRLTFPFSPNPKCSQAPLTSKKFAKRLTLERGHEMSNPHGACKRPEGLACPRRGPGSPLAHPPKSQAPGFVLFAIARSQDRAQRKAASAINGPLRTCGVMRSAGGASPSSAACAGISPVPPKRTDLVAAYLRAASPSADVKSSFTLCLICASSRPLGWAPTSATVPK